MNTPGYMRPTRNEIAREEAEDRLEDCIESGQHLTETNEHDRCVICGWAADAPDAPLRSAA